MSLVQFASLWNLTAVGIVLGLSVLVRRRLKLLRYFDAWTLAYGCVFLEIAAELAATVSGRHPALDVAEILVVGANIGLMFLTSARLPAPNSVSPVWWVGTGLGLLASLTMLALGRPFPEAAGPALVMLSLAAIRVGVAMLRQPSAPPTATLRWVGGPLIAVGLVPLLFPFLGDTGQAWMGYWLGGGLHLVVGLGLVVATLDAVGVELRAANDELRAQKDQLQALDQLKAAFVGTVSHELRTPLAAIKAAAWLIARDPQARPPVLAETIAVQTDALARLVEDLLTYSRIESGEMTYEFDPLDLRQLVEEVVTGVAPIFVQKGVSLEAGLPEHPLPALLDGVRVAQVLRNLLMNAHAFTPRGGRVEVTLQEVEDDVRLAVRDTGLGIPREQHAAIFERFHQVDGSASRRVGGAGLGLAICKAIVEAHGGHITLESVLGQGSTFTVTLPLEAAPQAPSLPASA